MDAALNTAEPVKVDVGLISDDDDLETPDPDMMVHRIDANGLQSFSSVLTEQEGIKKLMRLITEELEKCEKEEQDQNLAQGQPDPTSALGQTSFSDRVTHHLCEQRGENTKFVQVILAEA